MYQLGLCELHCYQLHGGDEMLGHYLLISTFADFSSASDLEEDFDNDSDIDDESQKPDNIFETAEYYNESYVETTTSHSFIRNYTKLINSPNYVKPEIMQVVMLDTGESIAILKTMWIRIFQRTWRRKFAKRMAFYKNIHNINKSRLTGPLRYHG